MKLLYKPFGLAFGLLAALIGKRLFDAAWAKIDDQDPPEATTELAPWSKVIAAAALQGVILRVTRVVVDRYGAKAFAYLTGIWPGERSPDRER